MTDKLTNNAQTAQSTLSIALLNISDTTSLAKALTKWLKPGDVVYLHGELGAGKTTLTRLMLTSMGVSGPITSPTYTLIEPYDVDGDCKQMTLLHMDLYRLAEPEELEYMGVRELFSEDTIAFIEWPARGEGWIPQPSVELELSYKFTAHGDEVQLDSEDTKRQLKITADAERLAHFTYEQN